MYLLSKMNNLIIFSLRMFYFYFYTYKFILLVFVIGNNNTFSKIIYKDTITTLQIVYCFYIVTYKVMDYYRAYAIKTCSFLTMSSFSVKGIILNIVQNSIIVFLNHDII